MSGWALVLPPSRDVLLSRQACRVGCRHCRSGGSCLSAASLRVRSWAPHWGAAHADISPAHAGTWWACSPPQGLPWWALEALPVALVQPRLCVHNRSDTFLCTQCCLSPIQTTTLTARRDTQIEEASSGHGCCELALASSTWLRSGHLQ